jgi:choline-sulfatase
MLVRWPGRLAAGERRRSNVGLIDLAATFADAGGAPWPGGGSSLLPLARDAAAPWLGEVTSEYCQGIAAPWSAPVPTMNRMVRRGRYKLCYYHAAPPQLFDLEDDPDELRDLADDPGYGPIRDGLLARALADWHPDEIGRELLQRERDSAVMEAWAKRTHPPETHRWAMPEGKAPGLT